VAAGARVAGSVLGAGASVGEDALLDDAIVGARVEVGAGARLLPGAVVGDGATIAPGAQVGADAPVATGATAG
jgi:mannose-1-phosphate guanylyltransferase